MRPTTSRANRYSVPAYPPRTPKAQRSAARANAENGRQRQMETHADAIIGRRTGYFSSALWVCHGTSRGSGSPARRMLSKTNLLSLFTSKGGAVTSMCCGQLMEVWLRPAPRRFSVEQDPVRSIGDYLQVKLSCHAKPPAESRLFLPRSQSRAPHCCSMSCAHRWRTSI